VVEGATGVGYSAVTFPRDAILLPDSEYRTVIYSKRDIKYA